MQICKASVSYWPDNIRLSDLKYCAKRSRIEGQQRAWLGGSSSSWKADAFKLRRGSIVAVSTGTDSRAHVLVV
jgi:hypothetical protein